MPKAPNFGDNKTLKLNKPNKISIFIILNFWRIVFESSFSIKSPILKINDCDFSIQDFVQGYPLQS